MFCLIFTKFNVGSMAGGKMLRHGHQPQTNKCQLFIFSRNLSPVHTTTTSPPFHIFMTPPERQQQQGPGGIAPDYVFPIKDYMHGNHHQLQQQ
jgi:hypothetical protein